MKITKMISSADLVYTDHLKITQQLIQEKAILLTPWPLRVSTSRKALNLVVLDCQSNLINSLVISNILYRNGLTRHCLIE